jgi:hypothetical protein
MDICEHCSELLLDYLYELLDEAEMARVRAHLGQCADCRSRKARAESQQKLIARAAKMYQSVPAFLPPVPEFAQPSSSSSAETLAMQHETLVDAPRSQPRPVPARRATRLVPWLVLAASVLIAVLTGFNWYQRGLADHEEVVRATQQDAKHIDDKYAALATEYARHVDALPAKLLKEELHVQVAGPATYRPNVGNTVWVNANSLNADTLPPGKSDPTDVTLRLLDEASGTELYRTKVTDATGAVALTLPPQLALAKAGNKWQLEVEANSIRASEKIQQPLVVAATGYVTQIVTSKPEYETGELLFFRTLTLEEFTLQPPDRTFLLDYTLLDGAGHVVKKLAGPTLPGGVGGGEFALTEELPDGTYTLRIKDVSPAAKEPYRFATQSIPVQIRQPLTPKIAFEKPLTPGAKVNYAFQGGLNNAFQPVTVTLQVKGQPGKHVDEKVTTTSKGAKGKMDQIDQLRADAQGNVKGTLCVPKDVPAKAQADLEFEVQDGKVNQKFVQTVPVVVPKWNVGIFPEGGDLVDGVPNRVYCQLTTPAVKASAAKGEVLDGESNVVATVALAAHQSKEPSEHLSGAFTFTP